jgi:hypothetical protein
MSLLRRLSPCLALVLVLILAPLARPQAEAPQAPAPPAEAPQATPAPAEAAAAPQIIAATPESYWEDMLHFIRVARPDLAQAYGEALLKAVGADDAKLLDIVQNSPSRDTYLQLLLQAQQAPSLKATATQVLDRLQAARMKMARDKDRIAADIGALAKGLRANENATARLRAAGQFAAPNSPRPPCWRPWWTTNNSPCIPTC